MVNLGAIQLVQPVNNHLPSWYVIKNDVPTYHELSRQSEPIPFDGKPIKATTTKNLTSFWSNIFSWLISLLFIAISSSKLLTAVTVK